MPFLDRLPETLQSERLLIRVARAGDGGELVGGSGLHKAEGTLRNDRLDLDGRLARHANLCDRPRPGHGVTRSRPRCDGMPRELRRVFPVISANRERARPLTCRAWASHRPASHFAFPNPSRIWRRS